MNNDPHFLERSISNKELAAKLEADLALVDQVEAGIITREAALEELIRRGSHPDLARRFLRNTLDQDKLREARERRGIIGN
ncbi:hypothetical protein [Prosthecobacter sp.]|uniref:hypothetical protein n=1 Tax=Prosthecobacter sp. TaxID=1965333 RepID=UPI003782ED2A